MLQTRRRREENQKDNTELVLKVSRDELFDPMILLPHNEINTRISDTVSRFTQNRKMQKPLNLTIITPEPVGEAIQEKFIEAFVEHYEDERIVAIRYVHLQILRLIIWGLISIVGFAVWSKLTGELIQRILSNVWAFTFWQIGYTFIDGIQNVRTYRRMVKIRDAHIEFLHR